jgi:hypothetical protein
MKVAIIVEETSQLTCTMYASYDFCSAMEATLVKTATTKLKQQLS